MMHQHLNEEDVHSLALGAAVADSAGWRDCPVCRERVEACRLLFESLQSLAPEMPTFDLEASIMVNLPTRELRRPQASRPLPVWPILVGSLAFLVVLVPVLVLLNGYAGGVVTWVTALALVTVPGIAAWMMIDAVQDHRKKLRSIGLR